jgi:hypothetical protein
MSLPYLHPYLGLSNGLNTLHAAGAGGIGGWVELARTTLGSASETLEVTGFADKRYLMFLIDGKPVSSEFQTILQTGNSSFDTGSNYAIRSSDNGGADATGTSYPYTRISPSTSLSELFCVGYIANYASKEKLGQLWGMKRETAGAGTAPQRIENVWKWANTSNVIDRLRVNENGSGTINTNSEMVVLGWDPADTHTNNFWEELASVDLSGGAADSISSSFTAKKYLWVQCYLEASGQIDVTMELGNSSLDTGNNYAARVNDDGGTDGTITSRDYIGTWNTGGPTTPMFVNCFIINNASNEKLVQGIGMVQGTAGAGTAPNRRELVGKWANTSNQADIIGFINIGTGDFGTKSILKVWGAD